MLPGNRNRPSLTKPVVPHFSIPNGITEPLLGDGLSRNRSHRTQQSGCCGRNGRSPERLVVAASLAERFCSLSTFLNLIDGDCDAMIQREACVIDVEDWPSLGENPDAGWWVLRTRSRQEKAVAKALDAMACVHFLPLVKSERFHGARKASVQLPLFPGYVFLFGERESVYEIDRTKRVASFLEVIDQELLHQELSSLRKAIQLDAGFDPYPYLHHGIWAEVKAGPYKGVRGRIDRETDKTKLILQVDLLQSAMAIELDGGLLETI